ncbi:hypothetical protein E2C01_071947 [Portunus trituberculatus]|uniref:Uncharacterized protein n=1 Tax=Portunus trituberculatus TaxID=210409 RepID=A0A5B7I196_PORTR|nr:hypothetical protein [Portunus trituberculatus]
MVLLPVCVCGGGVAGAVPPALYVVLRRFIATCAACVAGREKKVLVCWTLTGIAAFITIITTSINTSFITLPPPPPPPPPPRALRS